MTLEEYFADFKSRIEVYGAENGEYDVALLVDEVIPYLEELGGVDEILPYSYHHPVVGKIDGLAYSEDREELTLLVADYHKGDEIAVLGTQDLHRMQRQVESFFGKSLNDEFHRSLDETSSGYEAAEFIYKHKDKIKSLRVVVITNRRLSRAVRDVRSVLQEVDVSIDVWDITRIYENESSQGKTEELFFDFEAMGYTVPALEVNNTDKLKSYLCVVPGGLIADLYEDKGTRLIEANVRSFLQFKGNVNKGIRKTIREEKDLFFSYNNGLTATAREVELTRSGNIASVYNLQIVNGGQTTASLYATRKAYSTLETKDNYLDGIYVQMKLNVIGENADANDIISNISRYANSQNKINDSDFASNHPFHRAFGEASMRIYAPAKPNARETKWFYERTRGLYLNNQAKLKTGELRAFLATYPKEQLISKTDLAKTFLVFNGEPHHAIKGAEIAFREFTKQIAEAWSKMGEVLGDLFYKDMIAKHIVYQACKKIVYANNDFMGNTKATITAYTLSVLVSLMKKLGREFDLTRIWRSQTIPMGVDSMIERVSLVVNKLINQESQRANMAVLSYAKSNACLAAIMAGIEHEILSFDEEELALFSYPHDRVEELREAQQQRKQDREINELTLLVDYSIDSWRAYLQEVIRKQILTENEISLLGIVPRYLSGQMRTSPTPRQLRTIKVLMERLENEHGIDILRTS